MSDPVKRPYRSTRRAEQARETRGRILEAATELFTARGYAAASIAAVAEAAGVAPQTVYTAFGSKAGLLSAAIDIALAGDDRPLSLAQRAPSAEELAHWSPQQVAAAFARQSTAVLRRAGRLIQVADAAAQQDASLAPMWRAGHRGRLEDMRGTVTSLAGAGHLRDDLDPDRAAEILWVLTSPDTFRSFTALLGWSAARYERWLAASIEESLLGQ